MPLLSSLFPCVVLDQAALAPSMLAPLPKPPTDAAFPYYPFDPVFAIKLPENAPSPQLPSQEPVSPPRTYTVTYDINGKAHYSGVPEYPLPRMGNMTEYPYPPNDLLTARPQLLLKPPAPTLQESFSTAAQAKFVLSLDKLDPRISAKLDQPFGKDTLSRFFLAEPRLRHVLLPLWKSGFLTNGTDSDGLPIRNLPAWSHLAVAHRPTATFLRLWRKYKDVDFTALQGYHYGWDSETQVNEHRVAMATAALMQFNGSAADFVRWVGGPHVGAHRDHPAILRRLQVAGAPPFLVATLRRIWTSGLPNKVQAFSTEDNFQAFYHYGNHSTMDEDPEKTYKALVKDNKKSYTILFDEAFAPFVLNGHTTPQGLVDLLSLFKNPRPIFDSSFRPFLWCFAINDWTHKRHEPPLTFMNAEMVFMIWLYNLRITYPWLEILTADDDVSGAFRHDKYHPDTVGMHMSIQCGYAVLNTGSTFSDNTSPSNFDPVALARRYLSQFLWLHDAQVIERTTPHLPPIQMAPEPTPTEVSRFVQADPDTLNPGVLFPDGSRRPPPYPMHVDDNMYADIPEYFPRTVAASVAGLFDVLGWPCPAIVPTPLSMDKLENFYNHERKAVGRRFNSRTLSVGLLPHKVASLRTLLQEWLSMDKFDLTQLAHLLGTLDNHTRYARWARCWYFTLVNSSRDHLNHRYYAWHRVDAKRNTTTRKQSLELPSHLADRLTSLLAKEKAAFLWSKRATFKVTATMIQCLQVLSDYVHSTDTPWDVPIGLIVPRVPHFVSTGDASFVGCGGACPALAFWFDLPWTEATRLRFTLGPQSPQYLHINDMEFLTIILMLAAIHTRLQTLPPTVAQHTFPSGIPHIPVWLGKTDNMVSRSWEWTASASSYRGQSLLGVYSALLQVANIKTLTEHLPGEDNVVADDISRNDFSLPPSVRFPKLFQKHPFLKHCDYFLPSPEFLLLLSSRLSCEPRPQLCVLPKHLGHFVPAGCSTFDSPSL